MSISLCKFCFRFCYVRFCFLEMKLVLNRNALPKRDILWLSRKDVLIWLPNTLSGKIIQGSRNYWTISLFFGSLVWSEFAFAAGYPERYYQTRYCKGEMEVVLSDKTRCDCVTDCKKIDVDMEKPESLIMGAIMSTLERKTIKNREKYF